MTAARYGNQLKLLECSFPIIGNEPHLWHELEEGECVRDPVEQGRINRPVAQYLS